jgi:heme exporter protein D
VILVRSILSWHLPIALFDPVWLGLAAVVAAVVLLAVWIAAVVFDRRTSLRTMNNSKRSRS